MFNTYENLAKIIGKGILVTGMTVANWFGVVPQDYFAPLQPETKIVHEYEKQPITETTDLKLGATSQQGETRALFETSLASKITSTDTSMTLTSATDKDGNTLASSTYGFIIDEGTSVEEFVLADCTGTVCTNLSRGISVSTGTTTVSSLRFEHRRGASVKITDAPSLIFATNFLKGKQNAQNVLRYDSSVSTTTIDNDNRNLVNYELLTYTAFNGAGVVDASQTQRGVVELATQLETASSSSIGSVGNLAIPASNATSTYNSATAPLRVVVTQNNGKIDSNFLDTSTLTFNNLTITGISNIASTTIYATTTSGTWVKPANLRFLIVEAQGGGGGGGGCTDATRGAGGGGGGGYAKKVIPASALSATETATIGALGAGSGSNDGGTGGTTSFGSYISATGGSGGTRCVAQTNAGGAAGSGSGGDINIAGQNGTTGVQVSGSIGIGGKGGDSMLGSGGPSAVGFSADVAGNVGTGYGAGGSGATNGASASDNNSGAGTAGILVFTYVFY